jgi:Calcineurin-like phosphoesterase
VSRRGGGCIVAALAGVLACAGVPPTTLAPIPVIPAAKRELSLYLIGDAGAPDSAGEPVLQALDRDLAATSTQRFVVFLGDNVYPRGLSAPGQPDRAEAERRLATQLGTITNAGATGVFIPGNHDWARFGKDGWAAVRRQQAFIDSAGHGAVTFEPTGGCPGPTVVDVGKRVRLVLLDTQWWLHGGPKPRDPDSDCAADAEPEVVDSIRSALSTAANRLVVVAAHHPLASGGAHGGHFDWKDHLFPLRAIRSWLWIPLPLLGSLYPAARQGGISSQDVSSRAYQRLLAALARAFSGAPPALYAAGHEHNLQVIADGSARLELVSGGGIYGHNGPAVGIKGSLFAHQASGYARLDVPASGPARLAVLEVDRTGRSHEVFSRQVE